MNLFLELKLKKQSSHHIFSEVMHLKRLTFTFILAVVMAISTFGQSQMTVDTTLSPEELIKKVLLKNDNVKVDNIKYRGHKSAIGQFDIEEERSFSLEKGLTLSTGRVSSNIGPNSSAALSDTLKWSGDKDLEELCERKTFDAAVLEFDFIPLSNKVSFTYIFASEEYLEYSGSKYNDVFAFFISGPGIEGSKNMAILPRTENEFVAINSINQFKNQDYFVNNNVWRMNGKKKNQYELGMLDQELAEDIEFDGMTIALDAQTNVIPFKKYHFKIAIADVSDMRYNSAVFLKAGSFAVEVDTTAKGVFSIVEDIDKEKVNYEAIFDDKDFDLAEAKQDPMPVVEIPTDIPAEYNDEEKTFSTAKKELIDNGEFTVKGGKPINLKKNEAKAVEHSMMLAFPAKFENVHFDYNSSELTTHSKAVLDILVDMIKASPTSIVKLSGHTDASGSHQYNLKLSERRVLAVSKYLESRGVESVLLSTNHFGENKPVSSNRSEKGRAANRRVEIFLDDKK